MILYGYSMSSASYRVRIALCLKGIEPTAVTKQLRRGEHRLKDFLRVNPQGLVPALDGYPDAAQRLRDVIAARADQWGRRSENVRAALAPAPSRANARSALCVPASNGCKTRL